MTSIILPTPDVQAIQAGRKTSFRVPLMPQPEPCITSAENWRELVVAARAPYQPGDRLYVKETVTRVDSGWWYKSDGIPNEPWGRSVDTHDWWTAATMPREAARLFLMVKAVRVERVQEITEEQAEAEGLERLFDHLPDKEYQDWAARIGTNKSKLDWWYKNYLWHGHFGKYGMGSSQSDAWAYQASAYDDARGSFSSKWELRHGKPRPVRRKGKITHYISHPWEDVQETREHKGLPWYVHGNPWVWVVEFEREERK